MPPIPCWRAAASAASSPGTGAPHRRPTARHDATVRHPADPVTSVALRPLAFYDAVGKRLAADGAAA